MSSRRLCSDQLAMRVVLPWPKPQENVFIVKNQSGLKFIGGGGGGGELLFLCVCVAWLLAIPIQK